MALEEYRRKRDFEKTPEPRPKVAKSRGHALSYLIQKHDATRLHYDFRLELDGVLLSWAVTKGPSLNPKDKRLAVRTEDHPLSYGSFEGTIPLGQYGGGTVMLWDRGTWEPKGDPHAGLEKGHSSFELHGDRLKGGWDLIRMRGEGKHENWLLIKEADAESRKDGKRDVLEEYTVSVASGRSMDEIAEGTEVWESNRNGGGMAKTPEEIKKSEPKNRVAKSGGLEKLMRQYAEVELATLVDEAPEGDEWWHEIKFDGYRLLGFLSDGAVALRTRNGQDWTAKFPAIVEELGTLKADDAVLDMEAVVVDADGKSSFHALQEALGAGGNRKRIVAYVFDLLELDGKDLRSRPLRERKEALEKLLGSGKQTALRFSGHVEGGGKKMFQEACRMGLEGIVSKLANSPYSPGRQKAWLKIKCGQRQEFIIVGYSDAKSGGRALGALYLGYHDSKNKGAMKYAGKVGTGFTMKSAKALADRLEKIAVKAPVFTKAEMAGVAGPEWQSIHWVKGALLCEVAFTEWTGDGELRHPSFQGLREDKDAAEVSREKPVRRKASR